MTPLKVKVTAVAEETDPDTATEAAVELETVHASNPLLAEQLLPRVSCEGMVNAILEPAVSALASVKTRVYVVTALMLLSAGVRLPPVRVPVGFW